MDELAAFVAVFLSTDNATEVFDAYPHGLWLLGCWGGKKKLNFPLQDVFFFIFDFCRLLVNVTGKNTVIYGVLVFIVLTAWVYAWSSKSVHCEAKNKSSSVKGCKRKLRVVGATRDFFRIARLVSVEHYTL